MYQKMRKLEKTAMPASDVERDTLIKDETRLCRSLPLVLFVFILFLPKKSNIIERRSIRNSYWYFIF